MRKFLSTAISLVLVIISACSKPERPSTGTTSAKREAAARAPELPPTATASPVPDALRAPDDVVILDVNGDKFYRDEFESAVRAMPANVQGVLSQPFGRRALAEEIIRLKLLEQEGRRLDVLRDPDVARELDTETSKIIAAAALRKLANEAGDESELRKLYEEAGPRLQMVQTRQIVLAYAGGSLKPRSGAPLAEGEVMKKATALVSRVKAGEDFGAVAKAESDDPQSAQTGGAINVARGQAPAAIEAVLFDMKPDEIRGPVKSPIGIHVFQHLNTQQQSFDEVKPMLLQELRKRKVEAIVAELRKKASVDMDESYFGAPPKTNPSNQ